MWEPHSSCAAGSNFARAASGACAAKRTKVTAFLPRPAGSGSRSARQTAGGLLSVGWHRAGCSMTQPPAPFGGGAGGAASVRDSAGPASVEHEDRLHDRASARGRDCLVDLLEREFLHESVKRELAVAI